MPVADVLRFQVDSDLLIPVTGDSDAGAEDASTLEAGAVEDETQDSTQANTTTDEVTEQPDVSAEIEKLRVQYERDLSRQKSTFQQKESETQKKTTVLEKKLDELLQSTMDEGDKRAYVQAKLEEELETAKGQIKTLGEEKSAYEQMQMWKGYFTKLGIADSELTLDNGLGGLFGSGMKIIQDKMADKGKVVVNGKKAKVVPDVASTSTGKIVEATTLKAAVKHFADGNEEKFWSMAEAGNPKVQKVLNELFSKN